MNFSRMRYLIIWGCFALTSAIASEQKASVYGKFDAGDLKLHIECYGTESPSVIVHSGFGAFGSQGHWNDVIKEISKNNRICVYDRAHVGLSDKLSKANNINDISRRLDKLLSNVDVAPPYIMVGHSYGAYPVRAYNHLYPENVMAILLVDPSQYGMWANRIKRWHIKTENYEDEWAASRLKEDFSYWENPQKNRALHDLKTNEEIIQNTRDFEEKPFVLLWAKNGIWDPDTSSFKGRLPKVWQRTKDSYLKAIENMHKLSKSMKVEFSETSKHNIHFVEPKTVILQIEYLLNELSLKPESL